MIKHVEGDKILDFFSEINCVHTLKAAKLRPFSFRTLLRAVFLLDDEQNLSQICKAVV